MPTQVDKLIEQAHSLENLCILYVGWCPVSFGPVPSDDSFGEIVGMVGSGGLSYRLQGSIIILVGCSLIDITMHEQTFPDAGRQRTSPAITSTTMGPFLRNFM